MDYDRAFGRIVAQHALGPRYVGSAGHERVQELLGEWLCGADSYRQHRFAYTFFARQESCCSHWGRFTGDRPGRILLGSHYDTRPWADRDADAERRHDPVPGANDGASGVALLAELALDLKQNRDRPTVDIVFFDAEDWHDIDGNEVSLGARRFVADLAREEWPDQVVIVDMVAGRDLRVDFDVSAESHPPSLALSLALLQAGRGLGLPAFQIERKPAPCKWITCDHSPFAAAGIASTILIDIDYPPWHTTHDTPEYCDPCSLSQIGTLLECELYGYDARHYR